MSSCRSPAQSQQQRQRPCLSTVEWQLVFQCCADLPTVLSLARCSTHLLEAASAPFAWRGRPVVWIASFAPGPAHAHAHEHEPEHELGAQNQNHGVDVIRGGGGGGIRQRLGQCDLLRRQNIGLKWTHPVQPVHDQPVASEAELLELAQWPRLVALDTRERFKVSARQVSKLLSLPAFAELTELHVGKFAFDAEVMQTLLRHQPGLRALSMHTPPAPVAVAGGGAGQGQFRLLTDLPRLAHLTELSVFVSRTITEGMDSGAEHIAHCKHLRVLRLHQPPIDVLEPILTSAHLGLTLEALTVHSTNARFNMQTSLHWAAMLTNLRALHRLELIDCLHIDVLLPLVAEHASPALYVLRVQTDPVRRGEEARVFNLAKSKPGGGLPISSAPVLDALMQRRPCLFVELRLESLGAWVCGWRGDESGRHLPKVDQWRQSLEEVRARRPHTLLLSFADKDATVPPPVVSEATAIFRSMQEADAQQRRQQLLQQAQQQQREIEGEAAQIAIQSSLLPAAVMRSMAALDID